MKFFASLLLALLFVSGPSPAFSQTSCTAAAASCKSYVGATRANRDKLTPERCDAAGVQCRRACKNGKSTFVGPGTGSLFPVDSCS